MQEAGGGEGEVWEAAIEVWEVWEAAIEVWEEGEEGGRFVGVVPPCLPRAYPLQIIEMLPSLPLTKRSRIETFQEGCTDTTAKVGKILL